MPRRTWLKIRLSHISCWLSDIQDSLFKLWCTNADEVVCEKITQYQEYEDMKPF